MWIVLLFLFSETIQAADINQVKPIETAAFDKLITANDSHYLIVAMAAWCAPCRKELPILTKLYDKYKDAGLKMIGMGLDMDGASVLQPIVNQFNVSFPVYWLGEKGIQRYNITSVPMLLFIKDGKIVEKIIGIRPEYFLDKKIAEFLE